MNKLKLTVFAALLFGFSACDNPSSQKEDKTKDNTEIKEDSLTSSQENKEEIKEIVRDNRDPNGSYFKAEIAGVEKIFDMTGKAVKANHYDYNQATSSSMTRMVRYTSTEEERVSIQISGLVADMELPLTIPNDSLGVQMKFSYYYTGGKKVKSKKVLKPTNDFALTITEIKGDSLIGTFEGFLFTDMIANNDYTKVANGVFRFKLEGLKPTM